MSTQFSIVGGWCAMLPQVFLHHFVQDQPSFRVNLVLSTNSYFDSAVAATDDPCILVRWIGVHKDTHFVLVFSITTLCGDLFKMINHLFCSSLSCIEGGMMCICYSLHHEFVDWISCHSCASVDLLQLGLEGHFNSCISLLCL